MRGGWTLGPEALAEGLDLLGGYADGKLQAVAVDVQHQAQGTAAAGQFHGGREQGLQTGASEGGPAGLTPTGPSRNAKIC
jgi:hypothetical protein